MEKKGLEKFRIFSHEELGSVRTLENNGEIMFAATDVCRCLQIENTAGALGRLNECEKETLPMTNEHGKGGAQNMSFISESGLYSLIFSSRKPEAKAFKQWVTHEVIPSIRKHGGYVFGQEDLPEKEQARLIGEIERLAEKTAEKRLEAFSAFKKPPCEDDWVIGPGGQVMRRSEAIRYDSEGNGDFFG